jgi:hypothetical protein
MTRNETIYFNPEQTPFRYSRKRALVIGLASHNASRFGHLTDEANAITKWMDTNGIMWWWRGMLGNYTTIGIYEKDFPYFKLKWL